MPATSIVLGTGHLPGDHQKTTLQDVHLHLDCPDTPISLGERSGPQSIGAVFTLQKATDYAFWEHLRACGCEWLRHVADEERLAGRIFTPEEILQRRPAAGAVDTPVAAVPAAKSKRIAELEQVLEALEAQDFEEIEGLRDRLDGELVPEIAAQWRDDLPWAVKDAYAALLMDRLEECVRPLFVDALRSPTVESRAYAVCVLTRDFGRFDAMMSHGALDEGRVDAAVKGVGALIKDEFE
ncbi:MAG: hypothetical protein ACO1TE_25635 [Prosthecobacter sp.]